MKCTCGHPIENHNLVLKICLGTQPNCGCTGFVRLREATAEISKQMGDLPHHGVSRFSMIPYTALKSLADRVEMGNRERMRLNRPFWNGHNGTAELISEKWIISRLEHVIHHAMTAIGKIKGSIPDDGDDDAGAILFGGAALAEFGKFRQQEKRLPRVAAFKYSENIYSCLKCEFKTMNEKEMLDHQIVCFEKS